MNQILENKENNFNNQNLASSKHKYSYRFRILFIICIAFLILLFIYIFYQNYQIIQKNNFSQKMADRFEISRLYSSTISPNSSSDDSSFLEYSENSNTFDIIGMIKIESLNINYPILSNYSNELLKIAPCRISGPLPNQKGNLCIAAHNYNNSTFFSNIALLQSSDKITIYDASGNAVDYFVYLNYETDANDLSCMLSNEDREVTLITCNNLNQNKRIIIKAKERLT